MVDPVVAQSTGLLKRSAKAAGQALAAVGALLSAYLLAAWIGSSMPRNSAWVEPDEGISILVETNGLHTGIIMPIANDMTDWRTVFPSAARPLRSGNLPTHIAIGWGERDVFLHTPVWTDLSPQTALRIVTVGGPGLLRVGHYYRPAPGPYHRVLRLRPDEYRRLAAFIVRSLPPLRIGDARTTYLSYERDAVHYDARGRYTPIRTCNTWVGDGLASAGVKVGRWTPLAGGVMKWIAPGSGHMTRY